MNAEDCNFRAKESPEIKTVSRGRSSQRRTKQTKSYAEEEDDDEDGMKTEIHGCC